MKYTRHKYPDNGVYASIEDFNNPIITERINTYEDLFFIKSLKEICDYNGVKDVELIIPCMFQQQHDRRFNPNESFELKLVCDFINGCDFKKVHVFHPHSDSTQMGLRNVNVIDNRKFITWVLENITYDNPSDKLPILLSTDGGSYKWINKLADVIDFKGEVYGASKSRDSVTHKLTQVIDRQNFEGRDILICDDLCVFGGTFIGLAKMLRERNVGKLYLAVSHITVQTPNKELGKVYDSIFTTNSKFDSYELDNLSILDFNKVL